MNVSAGSPLLRVQTAPRHGGEGRRGHAVAAADPSRSYCSPDLPRDCSWESQCCSRGSQGCATTRTHDVGAKDALPGLLSSWGRKRKKNKLKKKKKALPECCTHTTNASMLFYPGIPMAPGTNTASAHARDELGSSRCKTHKSGSTTDFHAFIFAHSGFIKAGRATPAGQQFGGLFVLPSE